MKKLFVLVLAALLLPASALAGGKNHAERTACGAECVEKLKAKYATKAWLGVEYDKTDSGYYKIKAVHEGSPAEQAGFQAGDIMLAMNGVEYTKANKKAVKAAWSQVSVGSEVDYTVKRQGQKVGLVATLDNVPADLQAQWIAEYVKESNANAAVASTN